MATVLTPGFDAPPLVRLLTVADLAALPAELPSGPVRYELDNVRLVIMPPPGYIHGLVESKLVGELRQQGERRKLGEVVCGEVGLVLWRGPDRVVGVDGAFVANRSLPVRLSPEGYLEAIPDLILEVRSKNDTQAALLRKVADYLSAGVRLVWIADPERQTVTAHRPDQEPQGFTIDDTLTAEDIIPGFLMAVRDVFPL